jgi:hypothetical protein
VSLIDPFRCRFQNGCPILPGTSKPLEPIHWFAREWNRHSHAIGFHIRHKRIDVCESRFDRETYFIVRHWSQGKLSPILVGEGHRIELMLSPHIASFAACDLMGAIDPRIDRFVTIRWFASPPDPPTVTGYILGTGCVCANA